MDVFEFGDQASRNVLLEPIHTVDGMEHEAELLRELAGGDFCLRAVPVDWYRDLTPWSAPAAAGDGTFGDGAGKTLEKILKMTGEPGKQYVIGGYFLGGLFALWAGYQTDAFSGIAAASPSVWYPGFSDYAASRVIQAGSVYLSLGAREEKTRNPALAAVGGMIRELYDLFSSQGVCCTLEWNEGNHFRDPDLRTAKAFAWVLKRLD